MIDRRDIPQGGNFLLNNHYSSILIKGLHLCPSIKWPTNWQA